MVPNLISNSDPVRFKADWGGANLTRASGWLAQWIWERTPRHRPSVIHNGRGMGDSFQALGDGDVDIAIATPAAFARLAQQGLGPFEGRGVPTLRALAVMPHRDAMLPVVKSELGLRSLGDVAQYDGPLRVTLGVNDPDGFMGFAGDAVLRAGGIDLARIVANGGIVLRHEQPFAAIADFHEGRADLLVSEAIMTPAWAALALQNDATFLSLAPAESASLKERWGLGTIDIPSGYFPTVQAPITALDYSGWIITTTSALPDDIARLIASAVVENSAAFDRQYRHLPVDYSPLRYPIDYRLAMDAPIDLHPAAAEVYAAADNRY
jgi:TRAP-type uncharacterized transport system substrate-binding protein